MEVELINGCWDGLVLDLPFQTVRILVPTVYKIKGSEESVTEEAVYTRPLYGPKAYFCRYEILPI